MLFLDMLFKILAIYVVFIEQIYLHYMKKYTLGLPHYRDDLLGKEWYNVLNFFHIRHEYCNKYNKNYSRGGVKILINQILIITILFPSIKSYLG